jgi:hypothetical protein
VRILRRLLPPIVVMLAALAVAAPASAAGIPAPVAHGSLRVAGELRDGGTVRAEGLHWRPGPLPAGDRLLSFEVAYAWRSCPAWGGPCTVAAGTGAAPFAARRYVVAHADTGMRLELVETATEVVETDPATFSFRVVRASRRVTTARTVATYERGRAPETAFVNGVPEHRTGSTEERFEVAAPHYNDADGVPRLSYRIDGGAWRGVPAGRVLAIGVLERGHHRVTIRAANPAGATTRSFAWRVVALPRPRQCAARASSACWYPPHLDRTGHPLRWDWQIGRVAPLERTGSHAVDLYDIDGFLTTAAAVRRIHTAWEASTLPHPKAACYLDLAWEDYRPDGSPRPRGRFPARALGNVYYGYPQERWVDMRRVRGLMPVLDHRIRMCAAKGFDAVEIDDIDSFDPPATTGFNLTPGDVQNLLAHVYNDIHRHGMAALWKNSGLLSWWGRRYTDGAVVEECYPFDECFASSLAGSRQFGFTCTGLHGPTPCGWDDFTAAVTPRQPTGKWVGEAEYVEDGFVCDPGQPCRPRHRFSTYCRAVYSSPHGFAAVKLDVDLDGAVFRPCPAGR